MKSFQAQTHYEVLEISIGASLAEVKSAFERLSQLYSDDQVVLYGLIDPARAAALRTRLKEALEVLVDDERRDAYDAKLGLPPRDRPRAPKPPRPVATASPVVAGTGWGSYAFVSNAPAPSAPTPGNSYSWTVTRNVDAPRAPAPIEAPKPPPPAPVPTAPGVHQLDLGVQSGPVANWGVRSVELPVARESAPSLNAAPPVELEPAPVVSTLATEVHAAAHATANRPPAGPPEPTPAVPAPAPAAEVPVVIGAPPVFEPVPAAPPPSPAVVEAAPPPPQFSAPPSSPAVVEAAPPPRVSEAPAEPEVPRLADDDIQLAIVPVRSASREFKLESRPKPYEVPPDVEFNGDLLRQVRMARGLSLAQLAERTRIGMKHLENVEGDRYDALPAGVYLRGILMNVARELGLDGLRVSRSYLTFVDAHRSKG